MLNGDIALLPKVFDRVLAPEAVRDELANPEAPPAVRGWITHPRAWFEVRPDPDTGKRDDGTGLKIG